MHESVTDTKPGGFGARHDVDIISKYRVALFMSPEGLLLALHAIFSRKQTTNTPGISHPWLALLCVRQTSGAITGLRERPVICSDNGIVPRLDTVNHQ